MKLTRISPGLRLVRPGPAGTFSTGISRRPFGPCTVTMAPAATIAGTLSPAGEPLQRLPPADARPCTCLEPIRLTASSTPGQTLPKRGCSASAMPETAAPMRKPPSAVSSIAVISAIFLMSTIRPGFTAPERICTRRSVPPARMRAALPAAANAPIASSSVRGRQISDIRHGVPPSPFFCPPHMGGWPCSGLAVRKPTRARAVGTASGIRFKRQAPMREAGLRGGLRRPDRWAYRRITLAPDHWPPDVLQYRLGRHSCLRAGDIDADTFI